MSSETAWSKLPIDLQEQFYDRAEKEARRLVKIIRELGSQIEAFRNEIAPYIHRFDFGSSKEFSIAAVDGSFSPRPAETIGARFAVYSAGFIMIKGGEIVKEGYLSDDIRHDQSYTREFSSAILHVQESRLEREAALKALSENPDLILIDGSFLGFAYSLFRVRRIIPIPEWIIERARETLEMTEKLLDSGKCAGVVKRGRSRAIGGWLSVKEGRRNPLVEYLDKQILHYLMKPPALFNYMEMLREPGVQRIYSRVSDLLSHSVELNPENALESARKWAMESLVKALDVSEEKAKALESRINRIQIKVSDENPPFELEVPVGFEEKTLEVLLSNSENFNMATGLPMAIDLVDENVTLPAEFTREFVREVEARIIDFYDGSLGEVRNFFTNMNPQKEL
ncbi:MAG: DNA double-strand break repair nuclease NurA [Candidatus Brockarchaeota archaeon]|nr:DNA double-strand break repair nuclease NurA [Candidatus Brockarchaeota archaeon]